MLSAEECDEAASTAASVFDLVVQLPLADVAQALAAPGPSTPAAIAASARRPLLVDERGLRERDRDPATALAGQPRGPGGRALERLAAAATSGHR